MKLVLCPLPKEELSRYLSCYLKKDFNNGCQVNVKKKRKRTTFLPISVVPGTYGSCGLSITEVAFNNRVARVHMERLSERDILLKQASLLLASRKRGRKYKEGEVPTLRQLCEDVIQTSELPLKRRRGRPRRDNNNYEPKALKTLCEQVLNQQSPRRRGRKRKRPHAPLPLKELCKTVIERRKRGVRRIDSHVVPSLKDLCKRALGQVDGDEEEETHLRKKRDLFRSQRRKKFNKRLLGFADVPTVIKASYRDRLKRRGGLEEKSKINPRVYMRRFNKKAVVMRKTFVKPIKKLITNNSDSDSSLHSSPPIKTYKRKPKSNGILMDSDVHIQTAYRLKFPEDPSRAKSQITIKFTELLRDIQKVQLPSAEWKIKIILYNQQISQIVFSNKASPERCVNIYRNTKYYDISFDKMFVHLLGAPMCVDTLQDLNVLLRIVHVVKADDPMLEYIYK